MRNRIMKHQLRMLGVDANSKDGLKNASFRSIETVVNTSVPSLISKKDMIIFLKKQIQYLEGME